MGIGLRIFIVHDDNSLERMPITVYERLNKSDPHTRIPKFANKKLRCIEVSLDLENRKPIAINRINYTRLIFDSEGRLDIANLKEGRHLAMEILGGSLPREEESDNIVCASHIFAEKRHNAYCLSSANVMLDVFKQA